MTPNVGTVIARIQAREGGVANVGDGQGVTYYGQTLDWLRSHRLPIPDSESAAASNWAAWMTAEHLDAVCAFDLELGDAVCDACVNDGEATGIAFLQEALGVTADGEIGPETLAALGRAASPRGLLVQVLAADARYHGALITKDPAHEAAYAEGWANRLAGKIVRLA